MANKTPSLLAIMQGLKSLNTVAELEAQRDVLTENEIEFQLEDKSTFFLAKRRIGNRIKTIKEESGELDGIKAGWEDILDEVKQTLSRAEAKGELTRDLIKTQSNYILSEQQKIFFKKLPFGIASDSNKMLAEYYKAVDKKVKEEEAKALKAHAESKQG